MTTEVPMLGGMVRHAPRAHLAPVLGATGILASVGAAVWWVVDGLPSSATYSGPLAWCCLTAALAFAGTTEVVVEVRREAVGLALIMVPVAVGLVFLPPGLLLSAAVAANGAILLARRVPPLKLLFNLATGVCSLAVGALVYALFDGIGGAGWVWLGIALSMVTMLTIETAAVAAIVRIVEGTAIPARDLAVSFGIVLPVSCAMGLAAVAVVSVSPVLGWTVAAVAALLHLVSRSNTRMRAHQVHLEQLYDFTDGLATATEIEELARDVLGRARQMVAADGAALVVADPSGWIVRRTTADGVASEVLPAGDLHPVLLEVLLRGQGVLVPATTRDEAQRSLLVTFGWKDTIAVPLVGPDMVLGALVVHDRIGDVATFVDEDLRLLTASANHAAVAVRNAQLVEGLRAEVREKAHQATHDALTALPNRVLFQSRLLQALDDHDQIAVLLLDLDRFKEVNDTLGHPTGDVLLKELGRRLASAMPAGSTVARLGGDEFAFLLPGADAGTAAATAQQLRTLVATPIAVDADVTPMVGGSFGVALAPLHGTDPDVLLQRADVAMYEAKERDDGVALYLAERDRSNRRRLLLAADLDGAISSGQITLAYQPKVQARDGEITGFEALARWEHPVHGRVPPDEFVHIAEQTGAIHRLTDHVLETAVRQVALWRRMGHPVSVAVNLSPKSLPDTRLAERIVAALDRHGVPGSALVVELTESATIGDQLQTEKSLRALAGQGVKVSIDDFGTGHSSLARLRRLPVHELKVDKSFVMELADQRGDEAIVAGIIDLAARLGLRVVAEGVETPEIREKLRAMGAQLLQGYLISAPMEADAATTWLEHHRLVWQLPKASGA